MWNDKYWINLTFDVSDILLKDFIFSALEEQLEDTDIAPKFLTKFYDQTITDGLPATFQCMIAGKPMPVVR